MNSSTFARLQQSRAARMANQRLFYQHVVMPKPEKHSKQSPWATLASPFVALYELWRKLYDYVLKNLQRTHGN